MTMAPKMIRTRYAGEKKDAFARRPRTPISIFSVVVLVLAALIAGWAVVELRHSGMGLPTGGEFR